MGGSSRQVTFGRETRRRALAHRPAELDAEQDRDSGGVVPRSRTRDGTSSARSEANLPAQAAGALGLQRQVGNRATAQLLAGAQRSEGLVPRSWARGTGAPVPTGPRLPVQRLFGLSSRRRSGQSEDISAEDQSRYYDLTHVDPAILATIETGLDPRRPQDRAMLAAIRKERARLASEGGEEGTEEVEGSSSHESRGHDGSSQPAPPRGIDLLSAMLENPQAWATFDEYAKVRLIDENTAFLQAVRAYRANPTPEGAQRLWEDFVDPQGTGIPINVDSGTVQSIRTAVKSGTVDATLFNEAAKHILDLLGGDASKFEGYDGGRLWRKAVRYLGYDVPEPKSEAPSSSGGASAQQARGRGGLLGMLRSFGRKVGGLFRRR